MLTQKEVKEIMNSCSLLGIAVNDGLKLTSISAQLKKIGIRRCNIKMSDQQEKWNDTREKNLELEVEQLISKYGNKYYFYHQTDPRGAQVYITDMNNSCFIDSFNKWVTNNCREFEYYGDNLKTFFSSNYDRYGIAF